MMSLVDLVPFKDAVGNGILNWWIDSLHSSFFLPSLSSFSPSLRPTDRPTTTTSLPPQLKNHKAALTLLALTTRDHASAETYCLTRGSVITQRLARKVVEKNALGEAWAGFVAGWGGGGGVNGKAGTGGAGGDGGKGGKGGGVEEEEEETTRLLRVLLGVYVGSGGERFVFLLSIFYFLSSFSIDGG